MPVATPETYAAMLDRASREHYAYPAINVLQIDTLNAAVAGSAAAKSDGIDKITVEACETLKSAVRTGG